MNLTEPEGPKLIVVIGEIGAGKDKLHELVRKITPSLQIDQLRFSDPLKRVVDALNLPPVRKNFQGISKGLKYGLGEEFLAKAVIAEGRTMRSNIVLINGPRRECDMNVIEAEGLTSIYVTASPEIRHQRRQSNPEREGDDSISLEDFIKFEQDENDRDVPIIGGRATYKIVNNSSLARYESTVSRIWRSIVSQT